jgi:hypothetical protein
MKHDLTIISRFITEPIVEKRKSKKLSLEDQYKLAGKDEERNQEFKKWEDAMIGDGLNDANDWSASFLSQDARKLGRLRPR